MENSPIEPCFICNLDCKSTQLYLTSLITQVNETPYVNLIADLINNNYELNVTVNNKICLQCQTVCERYDELLHETRKTKAVLARQMAATYSLDTDEFFYIDTTKLFNKEASTDGSGVVRFTCRSCVDFVTLCPSTADKHFVYHEILEAKKEKETKSVSTNVAPPPPTIRREILAKPQPPAPQVQSKSYSTKKLIQPFFDDKIMRKLINLEELEDPLADSNVRLSKCVMTGCDENFLHLCDYVHHLKFHHKASLNQIFTIIRSNIKRPKNPSKLCCPFCFTKTSSESRLIDHVKLHEESTGAAFAERLNSFISNLISQSKCGVCGYERSDPSQENCSHEKVQGNEAITKHDCSQCRAFFYDKILLNNHLAEVHNQCFACKTTHKQRSGLIKHLHQHVTQLDQKCPLGCKNILKTKRSLHDHIKFKHSEIFCKHCNDWFSDVKALSEHNRYSHANLRTEEKPSICDHCGLTFKCTSLLTEHVKTAHPSPKMFLCAICKTATFKYRYNIFEHMSTDHQRKIVDNNDIFYRCFLCPKTFTSCNRASIVKHFSEHALDKTFCTDCNTIFASLDELEAHRSKDHLDFSVLIDKIDPLKVLEIQEAEQLKANPQPAVQKTVPTVPTATFVSQPQLENESSSPQIAYVQAEDGTILNNLMVNENGDLLVQSYDNMEVMMQNGHAPELTQEELQLQQIEQFLLEQGITDTSGISFMQTEDGQILLQTDESNVEQQAALIQLLQQQPDDDMSSQQDNNYEGDVEVETPQISINPENQAALDELGDILLEVAAAADNDGSPRASSSSTKSQPASRRRKYVQNGGAHGSEDTPTEKRIKKVLESENQEPVKNFSQAYEYFVKGFDAIRNKI